MSSRDCPKLYSDLAGWWPLLSPPEDYVEEAGYLQSLFATRAPARSSTLLDLGCGGGSLASHFKERYSVTLVDRSPEMLAVCSRLNPTCEQLPGDMRTVRLGRLFDIVLVHDAICYALDPGELRQTIATARVHCRPGGLVLLAPDHVSETFAPQTECGGHDGDGRALRYLEWSWDPDPSDTTYETAFSLLMREADGNLTHELDRHLEGLFPRQTWLDTLQEVGLGAETVVDPWERHIFLGVPK
jgi:SAM-dependent methyltransferase